MPYISDERAQAIRLGDHMRAPGELNYAVTRLGIEYLEDQVALGRKISYALLAETISQIEEAANEMRRRLLIPYEMKKQQEARDVYPNDLLVAVGAEEPAQVGPAIVHPAQLTREQLDPHPGYNEDRLRHNTGVEVRNPKTAACTICYGNPVACHWPKHQYGECLLNPKRKEQTL